MSTSKIKKPVFIFVAVFSLVFFILAVSCGQANSSYKGPQKLLESDILKVHGKSIKGDLENTPGSCTTGYYPGQVLENDDNIAYIRRPCIGPQYEKGLPKFSFTVCGDNRPADDHLPQPEIYLRLLSLIEKEDAAFHVTVGDIINGGTNDKDTVIRQFSDYLEATAPYIDMNFIAPGNHDLTNETTRKYFKEMIFKNTLSKAVKSDIDISLAGGQDPYDILRGQENADHLYYYFEYKDTYFILLNAYQEGLWGAIRSEQLEWLEDLLAGLKDEVVFVFLHPPPYSVLNPYTDSSKHLAFSSKENQDHIRRLLEDNSVDAVFSGHEHLYNKEVHGGTHYVITALSGEYPFYPEEEGGFYHYVSIDVGRDSWTYNVIGSDGKLMYEEVIDL